MRNVIYGHLVLYFTFFYVGIFLKQKFIDIRLFKEKLMKK